MNEQQLFIKIGDKIKEIRLEKGISQQDLAAKCNFEKANMSRIEAGRTTFCARIESAFSKPFRCLSARCAYPSVLPPHAKQSISTIYNTYVNDRSLKTCPFYSFGFNESSISMILSRSASLLNGILILPFPLLLHESCTFVPKKVHR